MSHVNKITKYRCNNCYKEAAAVPNLTSKRLNHATIKTIDNGR